MTDAAPWIFGDAQPDQAALVVVDTGEQISFGALNDRSARLANRFSADGLQTGDSIAILLVLHNLDTMKL